MAWAGWGLAAGVPLLLLGLFFGWPVATLVGRGFTTDGAVDLTGVAEVVARPRTARMPPTFGCSREWPTR